MALSILVSTLALGWLGWRDPKRVRTAGGRRASAHASRVSTPRGRKLAVLIALLPGIAAIVAGEWQLLLVWLGASCTFGWLAAQLLKPR